jgi:hypothetical protein
MAGFTWTGIVLISYSLAEIDKSEFANLHGNVRTTVD